MSSIVEQIEKEIASFEAGVVKKNVGRIVSIADGVAKLEGLSDVMYNEMIDFGNGVTALALNLEEDSVGCVILGDYSNLKEGDEASTTGKLLSVPVGKGLLGRVVDAIGRPVDGKGPIQSDESYPVDQIAPGIIPRKSVDQPLQTGIMAVDSMIPIGRGQRELIIGDRSMMKRPSPLIRLSIRLRLTINTEKMTAVLKKVSAPFIQYTSQWGRRIPILRELSMFWKKPMPWNSPSLSLHRRQTIQPTSTSPHSRVLRWVNTS